MKIIACLVFGYWLTSLKEISFVLFLKKNNFNESDIIIIFSFRKMSKFWEGNISCFKVEICVLENKAEGK